MPRVLKSTIRLAMVVLGASVSTLAGPSHLRIARVVEAASCPPAPGANTIVVENCSAGNPATEWDLAGGSSSANIQGFAADISVNKGDVVHFKIAVNPAG